jgi:hypothetical protein
MSGGVQRTDIRALCFPMRRLSLLFGFLILFIHSGQAQTHNPWEQVIPKARLGYGGQQWYQVESVWGDVQWIRASDVELFVSGESLAAVP